MSGGSLCEYRQYIIDEIADRVEEELEQQKKPDPPTIKRKYIRCRVIDGDGSYHFEYLFKCKTIAEGIEELSVRHLINKRNGRFYDRRETWTDSNGKKHHVEYELEEQEDEEVDENCDLGDYCCGERYSEEVLTELRNAVLLFRKASIYANRIDYMLSGDDGQQSFLKRLREELQELASNT